MLVPSSLPSNKVHRWLLTQHVGRSVAAAAAASAVAAKMVLESIFDFVY